MPLPTDAATEWPPKEHQAAARDLAVADAWWSGDPDRLTAIYGGLTAAQAHEDRRPSRLASLFWGRPVTDHRQRTERVHVPVAADIAATGADLLFGGDETRLQVPEAHQEAADTDAKATEDHLIALSDRAGLGNSLLEAAELAGALGGIYLRPTWDPATVDHPLLSVVHADRAVPEWRWGQLVAVTFWSVVEDTGTAVWRWLERHEPGVVLHGLYVGTRDKLGAKVDLADHDATKGLAVDDDGAIPTPDGIDGLLVRYVPNVRPNRRRRHEPVGRPDTQSAEPLMSALDETMTSWMRDIRLGQRRIIVPDQYLQRGGRGAGAAFDVDQEVFSPLAIDPTTADAGTIEVVDFALRTDDHARTAQALFERVVAVAQYSPQSFGLHGDGGDQTATEVRARENRSVRTTLRKRRYWGPPLAETVEMLLVIDREVFRRPVTPMRPRMVWPDLEGADLGTLAASVEMLNRAQAASKETLVRLLHPEWDAEAVKAEVDRVLAEQGLAVDDPTGGLP